MHIAENEQEKPMEKKPFLTPKQEKVLNFIRKRIGERLPPTIREIGEELGTNLAYGGGIKCRKSRY
jgi:hypothetical protein